MPQIPARLQDLGLTLPDAPKPVAAYAPVASASGGQLLFVSGQIPLRDGSLIATGRVGSEVDLDTARDCARQCVLNALAALRNEITDFERLRRVLRLGVFVACDHTFTQHPKVADAASELLRHVMGDAGEHARAAVGVPSLPLGAPVEIEFVFSVD